MVRLLTILIFAVVACTVDVGVADAQDAGGEKVRLIAKNLRSFGYCIGHGETAVSGFSVLDGETAFADVERMKIDRNVVIYNEAVSSNEVGGYWYEGKLEKGVESYAIECPKLPLRRIRLELEKRFSNKRVALSVVVDRKVKCRFDVNVDEKGVATFYAIPKKMKVILELRPTNDEEIRGVTGMHRGDVDIPEKGNVEARLKIEYATSKAFIVKVVERLEDGEATFPALKTIKLDRGKGPRWILQIHDGNVYVMTSEKEVENNRSTYMIGERVKVLAPHTYNIVQNENIVIGKPGQKVTVILEKVKNGRITTPSIIY